MQRPSLVLYVSTRKLTTLYQLRSEIVLLLPIAENSSQFFAQRHANDDDEEEEVTVEVPKVRIRSRGAADREVKTKSEADSKLNYLSALIK